MFKNFVDVRLNNSNLTLCIPQSFANDWNENTMYDGKSVFINHFETGPNLTSTNLQDHPSCKFFLTYEVKNMRLTRGSLLFTRYLMRRLRLYLIV